ncbi:MAG: hypothetical protein ABJB47_17990 [Actinomycetota bacterium]
MIKAPWKSRRARWAVPSGAVAAVLVLSAGSLLTSASAAPSLPPRTPAQLIAEIAATTTWPTALSGTITTSASLGLPSLPTGGGDPVSGTSILSGTHTFRFWYGGPGKIRIAAPVPLGETDLRVHGSSVWLWDSKANTATHFTVPSRPAQVFPGRPGHHRAALQPMANVAMTPTPQQIARQLLAAIGPTTTVSVASNVMVAGRPAYQLTLAPKSTQSLVGQVSIAVDAATHLPLRVQVTARGSASPAFSAGYTAISFAAPAASNFTFTPPPGAKVKNVKPGSAGGPFAGLGGLPLAALPFAVPHQGMGGRFQPGARATDPSGSPVPICGPGRKSATSHYVIITPRGHLGMPSGRGAPEFGRARMSLHHPHRAGAPAFAPRSRAWFSGSSASGGGQPQVIGTGWTAVHVLTTPGLGSGAQPAGPLAALLKTATPVHGSWGSGRLLRTTLLSVLITSDGKVLIGAVTPDLLYAGVAQVK